MKTFKDYCISIQQQEILKQNYIESNYALINADRPEGDPDSLTFSYDINILLEYLEYVKNETQKKGISKTKIRISLGKYPQQNFDSRLDPDFLNHQTLFFNAVEVEAEGKEKIIQDIDALDFADLCPPRCI